MVLFVLFEEGFDIHLGKVKIFQAGVYVDRQKRALPHIKELYNIKKTKKRKNEKQKRRKEKKKNKKRKEKRKEKRGSKPHLKKD